MVCGAVGAKLGSTMGGKGVSGGEVRVETVVGCNVSGIVGEVVRSAPVGRVVGGTVGVDGTAGGVVGEYSIVGSKVGRSSMNVGEPVREELIGESVISEI